MPVIVLLTDEPSMISSVKAKPSVGRSLSGCPAGSKASAGRLRETDMAKIVYGFGSSHGPLLSTPPERWDLRAADDRKNPEHPFRGGMYTFPELVELRRGERDFEKEMALETRQVRHERNQRALDRLGQKLAEID